MSHLLKTVIAGKHLGRQGKLSLYSIINHFTVACSVAWPLNESEAGGDIVLIETFLLFLFQ